jgi:hypothetical protein
MASNIGENYGKKYFIEVEDFSRLFWHIDYRIIDKK